jgi:YVTN family beta-propeller protein
MSRWWGNCGFGVPRKALQGRRWRRAAAIAAAAALSLAAPWIAAEPSHAAVYTVVATIPVGIDPTSVAVDPSSHTAYVANRGDNTVSAINGSTNTVTATIPVGLAPDGVGVDPSTGAVYEANLGNDGVEVLDGSTGKVNASLFVGNAPTEVGVDPSTHTAYVANNGSGTVSVIDGSTNTVTATIPVGSQPFGVGVDPSTHMVYVANSGDATVSVIDGSFNTVIATIPVGGVPYGIGVDPSTHTVYVGSASAVSVIDGSSNTVTTTIPVSAGSPDGIGVDPSTHTVYVASANNSIAVIDGSTNAVTDTIPVGSHPYGVGVDPSTHTIYVTNNADSTVSVISAGGNGCTAAPNPPTAVSNDAGTNRDVEVSWHPPAANCATIDHYDIVAIDAHGKPIHTVETVPASATSADIGGLNLCTFYRFGVMAVGIDQQASDVVLPPGPVFTQGLPDQSPRVITIILEGVATSSPGGSFNPLQVDDYCTSLSGSNSAINNGTLLGSLSAAWLNLGDAGNPDYAGPGAGNNLIDSAASTGGLVLPFSYNGATMTGPASSPTFSAQPYSVQDVAESNPNSERNTLRAEIDSINMVFPKARIILVGHSNGGLIAQQWWANNTSFSPGPQHNVVHVFTLDSPINGVAIGEICKSPLPIGICSFLDLAPGFFRVGSSLLAYYGRLWKDQSSNDRNWARQDAANGMWTPFITNGDPVYDLGDGFAVPNGLPDINIGFASQGLLNQPDCVALYWQSGCHLIPPDQADGFAYNDGGPPTFGLTGDFWVHSVVKNNSNVITAVMKYIGG